MQIYQESSSVVAGHARRNPAGPTTNVRSIETNVLVGRWPDHRAGRPDRGQLQRRRAEGAAAGRHAAGSARLFRYENKNRSKTNLLVFLRPDIIAHLGDATDRLAQSTATTTSAGVQTALPSRSTIMM